MFKVKHSIAALLSAALFLAVSFAFAAPVRFEAAETVAKKHVERKRGGGDRSSDGIFYNAGSHGLWWTAMEGGSGNAYYRNMDCYDDNVWGYYSDKSVGYSVRCLLDD